jgi:hypothetical protein
MALQFSARAEVLIFDVISLHDSLSSFLLFKFWQTLRPYKMTEDKKERRDELNQP